MPRSPEQAAWARRLPAWDDHRDRYPAAVIAIACLVSRGAMRVFDLAYSRDGRVIGRIGEGRRPHAEADSAHETRGSSGETDAAGYLFQQSSIIPRESETMTSASPLEDARAISSNQMA